MRNICPVCGMPEELCICEDINKETQHIKVYVDKRKYKKTVTIIEGVSKNNLYQVAKDLKTKCATGGTVKDEKIELQGDQKQRASVILQSMGYEVEMQ
ncbi:MAG: stress response translation initiation inhibitor YciH [Thermoplasmata archaeon]|jgi:translation initiation factor 1